MIKYWTLIEAEKDKGEYDGVEDDDAWFSSCHEDDGYERHIDDDDDDSYGDNDANDTQEDNDGDDDDGWLAVGTTPTFRTYNLCAEAINRLLQYTGPGF